LNLVAVAAEVLAAKDVLHLQVVKMILLLHHIITAVLAVLVEQAGIVVQLLVDQPEDQMLVQVAQVAQEVMVVLQVLTVTILMVVLVVLEATMKLKMVTL
jgi:hypothetical protein